MLTDWDFIKRLESLKFDDPDFELLVFGNSLPEYGLDTELLTKQGTKSYNMAIAGNSVKTSYIQLHEYLINYSEKPQHVLLVYNSRLDSLDGRRIEPIVEFTMNDHIYRIADVPISKFRWLGVEILKKIISKSYRKPRLSYGQIKSKKIAYDNSKHQINNFDIQLYESSQGMGEIAKLCQQYAINLIIIEMPVIKEMQNQSEIGPYMLHFKNGYSATLYNFNSQDFCSTFSDKRDWAGLSHFNETGAAKFTNRLIDIIIEKSNSDH